MKNYIRGLGCENFENVYRKGGVRLNKLGTTGLNSATILK